MRSDATYIDPATNLELNADLVTRYGVEAARSEALQLRSHIGHTTCAHLVPVGRFCVMCELTGQDR